MKTFLKNIFAAIPSKSTRICLSTLLVLLGCAPLTPTFQSKKDPSYEKKLESILVIYTNQTQDKYRLVSQRLGADFSDRLAEQIKVLLAEKSVPCEVVRLEDELDTNVPVNAAANRFGVKQQLYFWVRHVGGTRFSNRRPVDTTIVLGFRLWDRQINKTVWRTEATYSGFSPVAPNAAKQLVQELVTAGLL